MGDFSNFTQLDPLLAAGPSVSESQLLVRDTDTVEAKPKGRTRKERFFVEDGHGDEQLVVIAALLCCCLVLSAVHSVPKKEVIFAFKIWVFVEHSSCQDLQILVP